MTYKDRGKFSVKPRLDTIIYVNVLQALPMSLDGMCRCIQRLSRNIVEDLTEHVLPQIPIAGSLASMQGQLVHTNTIKVALSDEYVVEYSAKQARALAERRIACKCMTVTILTVFM